jgi:uncharacterized protein (DUF362 family)
MTNFVNIKTVFTSGADRTLEVLEELYNDHSQLVKWIEELTQVNLPETAVKDKHVLLKPNWVSHNRKETDEVCLRTHDNFLLAALEMVLRKKPASVLIGDAPVQGCDWDRTCRPAFTQKVEELSSFYRVPVKIKDFRRVTFDPSKNNLTTERNALSDYLIFDLGKDSCLEPISSKKSIFRVLDYDPSRLAVSHTLGVHKYCITKELFKADVVISLPKIKTHQKTGITVALKNIVGLNGDKDYLPHHRVGGLNEGGDCYPGNNILRRGAEWALDNANRQQGKYKYWLWRTTARVFWRLTIHTKTHNLGAGWYGNDTCWRMVMDLNKIVIFGRTMGQLQKNHNGNSILYVTALSVARETVR